MFPNPIGAKQAVFGAATVSAAVSEAEWLKAYTEAVGSNGEPITVKATATEEMFDHQIADLQENVVINGNKIYGKLKFVADGKLPKAWNNNYFLALDFTTIPANATSVKVGLDPSKGSGLVEIIDDPDKNGAFSIDPAGGQRFVVKTTTPDGVKTQVFDLSNLKFEK